MSLDEIKIPQYVKEREKMFREDPIIQEILEWARNHIRFEE